MDIKNIFRHLFALIFSFSVSFFKIVDPDFWWHINYGRYILNNGFPSIDPFTFHGVHRPFMQYYLADIFLYGTYSVLGYWGIFLLKVMTAFIIYILITKKLKLDISVFGIALLGLGFRFFSRPETFSFLFFMVSFVVYELFKGKKRMLIIFIVAIIWNQVHQSILIMILLPFSMLIMDLIKAKKIEPAYIKEVALIVVAFLINPTSIYNIQQYINSFFKRDFTAIIGEWLPYFSKFMPVSLFYRMIFVFLILILILYLFTEMKKLHYSFIISVILMLFTIFSRRFFPFFAISMIFILQNFIVKSSKVKRYTISSIVVAIFLINIFQPAFRINVDRGIGVSKYYDMSIKDLFSEIKIDDNIFNDYDLGGFLGYVLDRKVFIYGINLDKETLKDYIDLVNGINIDMIIEKYSINTIILKPLNMYPGGKEIFEYLKNNDWHFIDNRMRYSIWIRIKQ